MTLEELALYYARECGRKEGIARALMNELELCCRVKSQKQTPYSEIIALLRVIALPPPSAPRVGSEIAHDC